jgi:hypothetical protein
VLRKFGKQQRKKGKVDLPAFIVVCKKLRMVDADIHAGKGHSKPGGDRIACRELDSHKIVRGHSRQKEKSFGEIGDHDFGILSLPFSFHTAPPWLASVVSVAPFFSMFWNFFFDLLTVL